MQEITLLNQKCLANMPILLDTIKVSLGKLRHIFNNIYDEFKIFVTNELSSASYTVMEYEGNDSVDGFGVESQNLSPQIEISQMFTIERNYRNKRFCYEIDFGYICDEYQNVIFFQLTIPENSNASLSKIENNLDADTMRNRNMEMGKGENMLYLQFTVREDLSENEIRDLYQAFKTYYIVPLLSSL